MNYINLDKMVNGFRNKTIVKRLPFERYEITEYEDSTYSCNCPAWIFHKGERVNCKHINSFLAETPTDNQQITEITLQIVPRYLLVSRVL